MKVVFVTILGVLILIFGGVIWFSRVLAVGGLIAVVLTISLLYRSYLTAPECDSGDVTFAVSKDLSAQFPSGAITVRNIRTISGGIFSSTNNCEMEVAPMTNFDLGSMQSWAKVAYSTFRLTVGGDAHVKVQSVGPLTAEPDEKSAN